MYDDLRVLLVSLRTPDDPMAAHEHACFAHRAGLKPEQVQSHSMLHGRPSLDGIDLVLFGGSGAYSVLDDVAWIREGIDLMLEVIERQVPAWASCFGFQGLALALGGQVIHDESRAELGAYRLHTTAAAHDDPVFSVLPESFWAQEGHHDHVIGLPDGVTLMVRGDDVAFQAFKVDRAPFWAAQFHPELTPITTLDRFVHYAEHYTHGGEYQRMYDELASGPDSVEVGWLLHRMVEIASATRAVRLAGPPAAQGGPDTDR